MKKLILAFLAAVVIAALAFAFLVQRKLAKVDVATLVPADTVLLLHLPNVQRTRERWKQTALAAIGAEPEITAFLERPKSKLPQWSQFQSQVNRVLQTKPKEAFVAITSLQGATNVPKFIAGYSFEGKKEEVESLLTDARQRLQSAVPLGKSDLASHQTFTIETFTAGNFTLAAVFVQGWLFIADDLDLLKSALDRVKGARSDDSLRKNKNFTSSIVRLAPHSDSLFFLQPRTLADTLAAFVAMTGQPPNPGLEQLRKIDAISAGTKIEDALIRDTMFVLTSEQKPAGALQRNSLSLTSADTLLYYAALSAFSSPHFKMPDPSLDATGLISMIQRLTARLEAQGFGWKDFDTALGPEISLAVDWPAAAPQPTLAASLGVRDLPTAKRLLNVLTAEGWANQNVDGTQYYSMTVQGMPFLSPTLALNEKFLLLGLDFASLKNVIARPQTSDAKLDKTPEFTRAAEMVNSPGTAFGYIAAKPFFERVYGTARPFLIMSAGFAPKIGEYVDVMKLPATETISKHLGPIVFSQSATGEGFLTESVGPVTFGQAGVMLGIGIGAAAVPILKARLTPPAAGLPPPVPVPPGSSGRLPAGEIVVPGAPTPQQNEPAEE